MTSNKYFTEWKNKAMAILVNLLKKAESENNTKLANDLKQLISMLKDLRTRDLHSFLYYVVIVADYYHLKELLDIVPSKEEIDKILR